MILLLLACSDPVAVYDYTAVINMAPGHGAANVGVDTVVHVTFNDDLAEDSIAGAMWVEDLAGTPITSLMDYDPSTRTVYIAPDEDLERDSTYSIVVTAGVEGQNYGPVPADISSVFRTIGPGPAGGNQPPVAVISELDGSCTVGETYDLDGEGSYDPDGDAITWTWRIVDGPNGAALGSSDQSSATLTTPDSGVILVGLVVDDGAIESTEDFLQVDCE